MTKPRENPWFKSAIKVLIDNRIVHLKNGSDTRQASTQRNIKLYEKMFHN